MDTKNVGPNNKICNINFYYCHWNIEKAITIGLFIQKYRIIIENTAVNLFGKRIYFFNIWEASLPLL